MSKILLTIILITALLTNSCHAIISLDHFLVGFLGGKVAKDVGIDVNTARLLLVFISIAKESKDVRFNVGDIFSAILGFEVMREIER